MKKVFFKNYGITLIALVITIIILLIIAGVGISLLTGDNGILSKAKLSKDATSVAQEEENNKLISTELKIDEYIDGIKYYRIDTPQDLKTLCNKVNGGENFSGQTIILTSDIDLSGICSASLGSWIPIGDVASNSSAYFAGTFDGRGHKITNLYINNNFLGYRALFGKIKDGSVINLTIYGSVYGAKERISGIVAYIENGNIENCINYSEIKNTSTTDVVTAGIAGYIKNTTVKSCKNYGNILASYQQAGGIVGTSEQIDNTKNIENCENYGTVTSTNIAGGIIGYISLGGTIKNCYNASTLIKTTTNYAAGGIAGYCGTNGNVNIEDCNNIRIC